MDVRVPKKIGLLGTTGVGKDTCVSIINNLFPDLSFSLIQLADPLYRAQDAIYTICNKRKDYDTQDGELLNFLGQHMRKINPEVIKHSFQETLQACSTNSDVLICPDVRAVDVPFIKNAGFIIIHINADPSITLERRKKRGDVSLGNANHKTEEGINPSIYDYQLTNNGDLKEFEDEISKLITQLIL